MDIEDCLLVVNPAQPAVKTRFERAGRAVEARHYGLFLAGGGSRDATHPTSQYEKGNVQRYGSLVKPDILDEHVGWELSTR